MNDNLKVKLKNIKALFFDVDGTLTDGRIIYDAAGNELKSFFARDGSRITLALKAGLSIYFITSRVSESVKRRAEDRKINGVLSKNDFPGASFADFLIPLVLLRKKYYILVMILTIFLLCNALV